MVFEFLISSGDPKILNPAPTDPLLSLKVELLILTLNCPLIINAEEEAFGLMLLLFSNVVFFIIPLDPLIYTPAQSNP